MGRLSLSDQLLADTLLAEALDNEALFTIAGALKPMSTVAQLRTGSLRPDTTPAGHSPVHILHPEDVDRVARVQRVLDALDCGELDFMVVPFRAVFDSVRYLSAVVVDRHLMDQRIAAHAPFFAHWGLTPGADPGVVVTAVEFEDRYDRYRGYGLLFGYPAYAVDFFVEAAVEGDSIGELVPRDFVQMPVHSGKEGRFVYAVPRGEGAGVRPEDRAIREEALTVLAAYAERRRRYTGPEGRFRAYELYRDWMAERRAGRGPPESSSRRPD